MRQPEAVNGMMRQDNDLKKTEKMTNNDIQNIAQKKTFIHKNTTAGAAETPFFLDLKKRN